MDRSRGHIPELDGVRAIAVLMVLAAHWPIASQRLAYTFGGLGVSIFFTLSGFLITRILMFDRENGIGIRQFWITRAARIFPLSVAVLLVIGACFGFDDEWWQALTFTYNLLREPIRDNPVLGPFWSLCVEEQFYLLWPLIVLFCGVHVARRAAWSLITVSAVFLIALPVAAMFSVDAAPRLMDMGHAHTLSRIAAIAAGCLLALHENDIRQSPRSILLVSGAILAITLSAKSMFTQAAGLIVDPDIALPTIAVARQSGSTIQQTGVGVVINIVAIVLAFHARHAARLLRISPLQWIGRVSYCLYLIHVPIWWAIGAREQGAGVPLAVVGLLVTFIVAELSRRFFEEPIRVWARRIAGGERADQAQQQPQPQPQPQVP